VAPEALNRSEDNLRVLGTCFYLTGCVYWSMMNITDLTPQQLKRAAAIKEKLDALNRKLRSLLAGSSSNAAPSGKKRTMSAAQRRKIAAAQRARWAKLKRAD